MNLEKLGRTIKRHEIEAIQQYPEVKRWLRKIESPQSRSEYIKHITRYCESVGKNPTELIELKKNSKNHDAEDLLDEFIDEAEKINYSNSMIYSIVIAMKSFFKWNYEDLSRGAGVYTKLKKKSYRTPDKDTLRKFLKGASLRDTALINFMAASGISVGSIPNLKWKHVNLNEDIPHIALKPEEIKGKGKGKYAKVEQHTFLTPYAKEALISYKSWMERKQQKELTSEDYIFTNVDSPYERLGLSGLRALFFRRSMNAGITFSPHDLRRFCQTMLETARLQPNWIKKILRHKISGEENPYSQPKIQALRDAYKTALPYLDLSEKPQLSEEQILEKLTERFEKNRIIEDFAKNQNISVERVKQLAKKFDLMKMKLKPMQAKLRELFHKQTDMEDCQHMINESELEEWLTKGFKVVAVLPSGKVVVSND